MPSWTFTSPDGQKITINGPEGSTAEQALEKAKVVPKTASIPERIGQGFMDPIYGAAQVGARMEEEGEAIGAGLRGPEAEKQYETEKEARKKQVDETVRKRESDIQAKRGGNTGMDWWRAGGSALNPLVNMPLAMGGVPGAVLSGAAGGLTQPVTGENFGAEKAEQVIGGAAVGGALGAAGKAAGYGVRSLGEYLAREYPENVMTQAVQKILKRIGQDEKAGGPTAQQALDLINEASAKGKPMTLADVGGENVKALAGNVARQPGESRNVATQFLKQRDEGLSGSVVGPPALHQTSASQRLSDDVAKYVHGGESMHKTTEAILQARSSAARPAYAKSDALEGIWSPRLNQFINDPDVKRGLAAGFNSERRRALAENRPFDPHQMGIDLDEQGNIVIKKVPNMHVLDLGKRGLDEMISAERDPVTGRITSKGRDLELVRQAYLKEIDSLDKDGLYKAARQTWSGPQASLDAMKAGRAAFQSSPEEIASEISKLTPGDQEFYRLGVADMIRERIAKTGMSGDEAKAIIKNPWMRDQLKSILKTPADFDSFVDSVLAEQKMFGTKFGTLGGSQTAARIAEDESTENVMSAGGASMAHQLATGRWGAAAHTALRMWRDRQDKRGNPALNEQVAKILFQTPMDPSAEVSQRLTGRFQGPQSVNRLSNPADALRRGVQALAPGGGAAWGQNTSPPSNPGQ